MSTLCIVPCGSRKIWDKVPNTGPTPAREVYTGVFASKCRKYAEMFHPTAWCILSAKHGFLFPDDIVPGPYNVTFKDRKTNSIPSEQLKVQAAKKGLSEFEPIVVLGGKNYVAVTRKVFAGKAVLAPLAACGGIGCILKRLKAAILSGKPLSLPSPPPEKNPTPTHPS